MLRARKKVSFIAVIIVGVMALVGVTFATVFRAEASTDVAVYPTSINANINLTSNLTNVSEGDIIGSGMSFSKTSSSGNIYVRAYLEYYKEGTLSDQDLRYLVAVNFNCVITYYEASYKWTKGADGFYYLTDSNGVPLLVSTTTTYTFCRTITYNGVKVIRNDTPIPTGLKIRGEIQTVHAKNVTNPTLETLSTLFSQHYAPKAHYGYLVRFMTDGGNLIAAQTIIRPDQKIIPPPVPVKPYHRFYCWSAQRQDNIPYDLDAPVTSDLTLWTSYSIY